MVHAHTSTVWEFAELREGGHDHQYAAERAWCAELLTAQKSVVSRRYIQRPSLCDMTEIRRKHTAGYVPGCSVCDAVRCGGAHVSDSPDPNYQDAMVRIAIPTGVNKHQNITCQDSTSALSSYRGRLYWCAGAKQLPFNHCRHRTVARPARARRPRHEYSRPEDEIYAYIGCHAVRKVQVNARQAGERSVQVFCKTTSQRHKPHLQPIRRSTEKLPLTLGQPAPGSLQWTAGVASGATNINRAWSGWSRRCNTARSNNRLPRLRAACIGNMQYRCHMHRYASLPQAAT